MLTLDIEKKDGLDCHATFVFTFDKCKVYMMFTFVWLLIFVFIWRHNGLFTTIVQAIEGVNAPT